MGSHSSRIVRTVVFATLLIARPFHAATFELTLLTGAQAAHFHGVFRHLDVAFRTNAAPVVGAEAAVLLGERSVVGVTIREFRPRTYAVENGVHYDGGRMTMRPSFVSYDFRLAPHGAWEPRIGAGYGIIFVGGKDLPATPSAPLIAVRRPDHPALLLRASLGRMIGRHGLVRFGVDYGPFNSTAEFRRAQYPRDDILIDFHPLAATVAAGFRF